MTEIASVETGTAPVAAGREPLSGEPTRRAGARNRDLARLRVEHDRHLMVIRRAQARMTADHDDLERRLDAFDQRLQQAELHIEALWRRQRWGHDPERPAAWRSRTATRPARARRQPQTKSATPRGSRRSPPRRQPAVTTTAPTTSL